MSDSEEDEFGLFGLTQSVSQDNVIQDTVHEESFSVDLDLPSIEGTQHGVLVSQIVEGISQKNEEQRGQVAPYQPIVEDLSSDDDVDTL